MVEFPLHILQRYLQPSPWSAVVKGTPAFDSCISLQPVEEVHMEHWFEHVSRWTSFLEHYLQWSSYWAYNFEGTLIRLFHEMSNKNRKDTARKLPSCPTPSLISWDAIQGSVRYPRETCSTEQIKYQVWYTYAKLSPTFNQYVAFVFVEIHQCDYFIFAVNNITELGSQLQPTLNFSSWCLRFIG